MASLASELLAQLAAVEVELVAPFAPASTARCSLGLFELAEVELAEASCSLGLSEQCAIQ